MLALLQMADSPDPVGIATRWSALNYVRHGLVLAAWLAALKALALWHVDQVVTRRAFTPPQELGR